MMRFSPVMRVLIVLLVLSRVAFAEDKFAWNSPEPGYLWNGGAVPFLYLPLAGYITVRTQYQPRDTPLMFSANEGGARYDGGQYPTPMLYVDGALVAGAIVLAGDDSRWYHLKGFAEAMATTQLLTVLAKSTFGRHRPSYDPDGPNTPDQHKSFWSGHASATVATATYLGLYARQHLFDRWRPHGEFRWWEGAAYAALTVSALSIPYSQYALHRHHASDVIVGGLVGAATSTAFYIYQEHRYRNRRGGEPNFTIVPEPSIRGFAVVGRF